MRSLHLSLLVGREANCMGRQPHSGTFVHDFPHDPCLHHRRIERLEVDASGIHLGLDIAVGEQHAGRLLATPNGYRSKAAARCN